MSKVSEIQLNELAQTLSGSHHRIITSIECNNYAKHSSEWVEGQPCPPSPFLSTPLGDSDPSNFFRHQSASLHKRLLTKEKKEKFFRCSIVGSETMETRARLILGALTWGSVRFVSADLCDTEGTRSDGARTPTRSLPFSFFLSLHLSCGWFNLTSVAN